MRLWSLHPKYLDTQGLLAVWREGLLAQKVLLGETKGYKHHPQLIRFKKTRDPIAAIGKYLQIIAEEAGKRGFLFQTTKIQSSCFTEKIVVHNKQLEYEWNHFLHKSQKRSPQHFLNIKDVSVPQSHPLFVVKEGSVEEWERV